MQDGGNTPSALLVVLVLPLSAGLPLTAGLRLPFIILLHTVLDLSSLFAGDGLIVCINSLQE